MKSRVGLLFCILLFQVLARGAEPLPANYSFGAHAALEHYRTQPGTAELPPRYQPPAGHNPSARLAYWNEVASRAVAIDHTPPLAGAAFAPEQLGPTRSSRALAIVHLAIYDALNAIHRRYPAYSRPLPAFADSSPDAAIAQAAHDTLAALYPRQARRFDTWLAEDLARLRAGRSKLNGIDIGRRAAAAILALRSNDGMYEGEPVVGQDYPIGSAPGQWRPDPDGWSNIAMGAHWRIRPFVLPSMSAFLGGPPPAMRSEAYTRAFDEVKAIGSDGFRTPTSRTPEQTRIATYWAYDGTAWIGTPPRMYNQITVQLAHTRARDALELARVLALVNVAIADATIAVWETKYRYDFWRPVTAIHDASPGDSPDGRGDGNRATHSDPGWTPLGAPASNLIGPNFTPPFPAYPSGHAGLGGALFEMLRRLYGDSIPFTFMSDEFNGITRDHLGQVRPLLPRSFHSLSEAEQENGQSRIYQGVHWRFDMTEGAAIGHRVADYVFRRGLLPPAN
jgi:membrane-associated phospholipid phosphatase